MGNSQLGAAPSQDQFVKAKKIIKRADESPLADITNQLQQVFGVSSLPSLPSLPSHRAQPPSSPRESFHPFHSEAARSRKQEPGGEYNERISHLESQIYYLKSVIEEMQGRSGGDSPIRSEIVEDEPSSGSESQSRQINASHSRMSVTYFQSRTKFNQEGRRGEEDEISY